MEGPVSASMGVMVPLLSKLQASMEQSRFKDVTNDLKSLKSELASMEAVMRKFATQDDTDLQVKEWMRQVREVGYDIDDWIDSHPPMAAETKGSRLGGGFFSRNNRRRKLAELIKELRERVEEASQRRTRYVLQNAPAVDDDLTFDLVPSNVTVDPQLLYGVNGRLVGLDEPVKELVGKLRPGGEQQHFKVVSIVGGGGLGKTTLAKEVYRKIHGEFESCAFVTVGQNPHIRTVLLNMLLQLNPLRPQGDDSDTEKPMDEPTVVGKLREFLYKKRYFIAIDDIWSISAWKDIKCALPENTPGSRIVTTTRISDVAKSCSVRPTDFTLLMKPLSEIDSKQLFLSRLQSPCKKTHSSETDLEEVVFRDVWNICGGMPLAMIVIAGMMNRKSPGCLDDEKSIKKALEKHPTLQGMRRILRICYSDLSLPVKTCLLYLSIFPEDATVEKNRLIWRWIAEGFVGLKRQEQLVTSWATAESYFNELVNRQLIQPVETGDVVKVKVHDVVLEFIASVAAEENFVTSDMVLRCKPRDIVRRASLNCTDQEDSVGGLSQVRSLTVFGACAKSMMSSIVYLQLLRVLDVKDATGLKDEHMQGIERLSFLKYLGLGGKSVTKLPEKWKELKNLETLDVRETAVTELPEAIARRCSKLACLLARSLSVGKGIDSMLQLQELSMVSVTDAASLDSMTKLVVSQSLTKLRKLGVSWSFDGTGDQHAMPDLAASLQQIEKCGVESLLLDVVGEGKTLDRLVESWAPPRRLQKFTMRHYYFPKAPPKMASHESLSHLEISIAELRKSDVDVLCSMPSLFYLKLSTRSSPPEAETVVITNEGFQCLQVWWFKCQDGGLGFDFGDGAMVQLLKLDLHFTPAKKAKLPCISNLSSLRQIHATVCCLPDSEFKATEESIKQLVSNHSNNPTWEVTMELDKPTAAI